MKILFFNNEFFPQGKHGQCFDQNFNFNQKRGVAIENQGVFFASGINNGGEVHFIKNPSMNLNEWVLKSFGDSSPIESDYQLGTFYKRIFRPMNHGLYPQSLIPQEELNGSFIALRILLNKLEELFETVEPNENNLLTYGHKIREVLLLACMEVESAWTSILKENGYSSQEKRFTTEDYVKLKEIMFLDVYELSLQTYPHFPGFKPFKDWNISMPTQSLSWYHAYNQTKHDREKNLKFATLENAIYAVGAVVIMFYAQFGRNFGIGIMDQKSPIIRNIFKIVSINFEKYEKDFYISKLELDPNSGKPISSLVNNNVNYPFI